MADRGREGTTMYHKNGLLYWILDDRGNQIGVPIKASALVSRPTMKNLQSTLNLMKADKDYPETTNPLLKKRKKKKRGLSL